MLGDVMALDSKDNIFLKLLIQQGKYLKCLDGFWPAVGVSKIISDYHDDK